MLQPTSNERPSAQHPLQQHIAYILRRLQRLLPNRRMAHIHPKADHTLQRAVSSHDNQPVPDEHENLVERVLRSAHGLHTQTKPNFRRVQDKIRGQHIQRLEGERKTGDYPLPKLSNPTQAQ